MPASKLRHFIKHIGREIILLASRFYRAVLEIYKSALKFYKLALEFYKLVLDFYKSASNTGLIPKYNLSTPKL